MDTLHTALHRCFMILKNSHDPEKFNSIPDFSRVLSNYVNFYHKEFCLNIYKIIYDIPEINFIKIDAIAPKLNIDKNDKRRIKATIIYIMTIALIYL